MGRANLPEQDQDSSEREAGREAARVHHASWQRGGRLVTRGARAAGGRPVIGYLDGRAGAPNARATAALRAGLTEAGLVDGTHFTIEYSWGGTQPPRLRSAAEELVTREVAVILAAASLGPSRAAMAATSIVPIVFVYGGDPVKDGLVASMNRPGGNVTGVTALATELAGKRLDLLHKLVPNAMTIGFLSGTPGYVSYVEQTTEMLAAGRALGLQIQIVECRDDRDYDAAFAALMRSGAGALILGSFPLPNIGQGDPLGGAARDSDDVFGTPVGDERRTDQLRH